MRYDNHDLRDLLSGKYVLGVLKGAARARYEALARSRPDYEEMTLWWQNRLHLIADTVPAVKPKKRVWLNIESRLFNAGQSRAINWWRNLALTTSLLSVALSVFIATELLKTPSTPVSPMPTTIAMLADSSTQEGWIVSFSRNADGEAAIKATALAALEKKDDHSFELWLLPADQSPPVSLGLLPQDGSAQLIVKEDIVDELLVGGLAVSLEPLGGSPTSLPTGPVLYQGKLAQI
jgi:anti-sigma-K factor RskA